MNAPPSTIADPVAAVDEFLFGSFEAADWPGNLKEAVAYAALGPGKRLRPVLAIRSCEAVGADGRLALPAAGAIEMVHAFSLVHDDLPAMDDDDLRRGRPTCHVKFGEAMAILVGDLLATFPYQVIADGTADGAKAARMTRELAEATAKMIAGQVYDTLGGFPDGLSDREQLERTHRHKTGALIRAACRLGAIAGDASDDRLDALTGYGEAMGLMFQVVDDLLDVTQTAEHLGKRTNKDEAAGKITYPAVIGVEESKRLVEQLLKRAVEVIAPLGPAAHPLVEIAERMAVRTK